MAQEIEMENYLEEWSSPTKGVMILNWQESYKNSERDASILFPNLSPIESSSSMYAIFLNIITCIIYRHSLGMLDANNKMKYKLLKLNVNISGDSPRGTYNNNPLNNLHRRTVDASWCETAEELYSQIWKMLNNLQNEPYSPSRLGCDEQYLIVFQEIWKDLIKINEDDHRFIKELFIIELQLSDLIKTFEGSPETSKFYWLYYINCLIYWSFSDIFPQIEVILD